jgi:hypothetical protein
MDNNLKTILIAMLNLMAEARGPQPVDDKTFFEHDECIRQLIEKAESHD